MNNGFDWASFITRVEQLDHQGKAVLLAKAAYELTMRARDTYELGQDAGNSTGNSDRKLGTGNSGQETRDDRKLGDRKLGTGNSGTGNSGTGNSAGNSGTRVHSTRELGTRELGTVHSNTF
jgi:hypothetical protein